MKIKSVFFALYLISLLIGCKKKEAEQPAGYVVPDYRSWKRPTEAVCTIDIPDHVGTYRIIYANDRAFENVRQTDRFENARIEKKDGAIIVKETYFSMEDLKNQNPYFTTIMIKDSKNPIALHGWVFVQKFPEEKYGRYMQTRYCLGCHEGANESHPFFDQNVNEIFRDYLFLDFGT